MPKLYDNAHYTIHMFRGTINFRVYMLCKYWNSNSHKAVDLYCLLKRSGKYNKIKLHNNCVYATKNLITKSNKRDFLCLS